MMRWMLEKCDCGEVAEVMLFEYNKQWI